MSINPDHVFGTVDEQRQTEIELTKLAGYKVMTAPDGYWLLSPMGKPVADGEEVDVPTVRSLEADAWGDSPSWLSDDGLILVLCNRLKINVHTIAATDGFVAVRYKRYVAEAGNYAQAAGHVLCQVISDRLEKTTE